MLLVQLVDVVIGMEYSFFPVIISFWVFFIIFEKPINFIKIYTLMVKTQKRTKKKKVT